MNSQSKGLSPLPYQPHTKIYPELIKQVWGFKIGANPPWALIAVCDGLYTNGQCLWKFSFLGLIFLHQMDQWVQNWNKDLLANGAFSHSSILKLFTLGKWSEWHDYSYN